MFILVTFVPKEIVWFRRFVAVDGALAGVYAIVAAFNPEAISHNVVGYMLLIVVGLIVTRSSQLWKSGGAMSTRSSSSLAWSGCSRWSPTIHCRPWGFVPGRRRVPQYWGS